MNARELIEKWRARAYELGTHWSRQINIAKAEQITELLADVEALLASTAPIELPKVGGKVPVIDTWGDNVSVPPSVRGRWYVTTRGDYGGYVAYLHSNGQWRDHNQLIHATREAAEAFIRQHADSPPHAGSSEPQGEIIHGGDGVRLHDGWWAICRCGYWAEFRHVEGYGFRGTFKGDTYLPLPSPPHAASQPSPGKVVCPSCHGRTIPGDGTWGCDTCQGEGEISAASQPAAGGGELDSNVSRVIDKHRQRAAAGLIKYGVTTERTDLSRSQWLQHAQDEAMDLAVYLERLMGEEPLHQFEQPQSSAKEGG